MLAMQHRSTTVLHRMQEWEHWSVIQQVAEKEYGMSKEEFYQLLPEYQRFLNLIAVGYVGLGMHSQKVDALWHSHILCTQLYADFCQRFVGRFVHHEPLLAEQPETGSPPICASEPCKTTCKTPRPGDGERQPSNFYSAYLHTYGCEPGHIWTSNSDGFAR